MAAGKRNTKKSTKKTSSRDQENRDSDSREASEFDPSVLDDLGPLPDIPARVGYAQRWVRVMIGKENDARNLAMRSRRGWKPRQANTVSTSMQYMTENRAEFGDVIGTHDCILMERPIEIQKKVENHERAKVAEQTRAVKHNLFREHQNLGGVQTGFDPRDESQSRVIKGAPQVMED